MIWLLKRGRLPAIRDMTQTADISVIMPCYNGARFIEAAIDSVRKQEGVHLELIVIDDGSDDRSVELVQKQEGAISLYRQSHQGANAARNLGIRKSVAEFIYFLDADDVLRPFALKKLLQEARKYPVEQRVVPFGLLRKIDEQGKSKGILKPLRGADESTMEKLILGVMLTSCPLHRKVFLEEIGGFDETLLRAQEYNLHLRLGAAGVRFVRINEVVYDWRQHGDPDRISNQRRYLTDPDYFMQFMRKNVEVLRQSDISLEDPGIRRALAFRYWLYGRLMVQGGQYSKAKEYFSKARVWDSAAPHHFSPFYQIAHAIAGPYIAEKLIGLFTASVW